MRTILITGISRGLGLRLTEYLTRDRDIYVIGISRTCSADLTALLEDRSNVEWHRLDLSGLDTLERRLTDIIAGRQIDAVVNNAAVLYKSLLVKADVMRFREMMDVNISAPLVVSKVAVANFMRFGTGGVLLFYSSICAHKGFSGLSMMGSTKGAIESFSKNIAFEYGRKGIRSNVISIGILDTGMSDTVNERQYADIVGMSDLSRCTDSGSVLELSRYLLSTASMSVTGQVFHVNCGIL